MYSFLHYDYEWADPNDSSSTPTGGSHRGELSPGPGRAAGLLRIQNLPAGRRAMRA